MKLSLFAAIALAAILASTAQAAPSLSLCKTAIDETAQLATHIQDRFTVGEVTTTDVASVDLALLNIRYECRDILAVDYCAKALPIADILIDGVAREANVGSRTIQDVIDAKMARFTVQAQCQ